MQPSPLLPEYIDSTMRSCFKSCRQKFYKEFILGLRPARLSIDLHAGACFATALETVRHEYYAKQSDMPTALGRAFARFTKDWNGFVPIGDTPKTETNTWAAVESYFQTYPPAMDTIQPYNLAGSLRPTFEFSFALPLEPAGGATYTGDHFSGEKLFPLHPVTKQPFLYCGRFDMLGEYQGLPIVLDEKTTKSIGASWGEQWDLRAQFMGYVWACQQSGIPLEHVAVRGVGILKTKISHAEAIKVFPKHLIERWHEQLRRDLWDLVRCWDSGYWDYDFADACSSYGGCAFRDLCGAADEQNWYANYNVRRWNPLLKNPIAEEGKP